MFFACDTDVRRLAFTVAMGRASHKSPLAADGFGPCTGHDQAQQCGFRLEPQPLSDPCKAARTAAACPASRIQRWCLSTSVRGYIRRDYVRSTLASIALWRDRPDADPRIFELLVKDLVKYLLPQLADPDGLARGFEDLGAPADVAVALGRDVAQAITDMAQLGEEDPAADGAILDRIADAADRTAAGIERLAEAENPKSDKLRKILAKGAATELGKVAAGSALAGVGSILLAEWPKIQLALLSGWHRIAELWR